MRRFRQLWAENRASQIVEFALSAPILVFFVVGIYDFSGALALKQKLTNAAREGARIAAADPSNDLSGAVGAMPVSVNDAWQVVDNYLVSEKLNDCGLNGAAPSPSPSNPLTWTFTTSGNGCPSGVNLVLTVNRGYYFAQSSTVPTVTSCSAPTSAQTVDIGTCVSISYPYQWQFNFASGLFGQNFLGPSTITTATVAFNED
jgi:Flp pilus assembly protein TadG